MIVKSTLKNIFYLLPPLLIFLPSKAVSLFFLVLYFTYKAIGLKTNYTNAIILFIILFFNLITTILTNGFEFIYNYILFWVFLLPVIFFIIEEPSEYSARKVKESKIVIEWFLYIQIFFAILQIYHRLSIGYSFDVEFGDIIAGTLRNPFTYTPDASNVIFAFSIILILFIYISIFKYSIRYFLLFLSLFVFFLASVNHLILIGGIALSLSMFWKYPFKVSFIIMFFLIMYLFLQPKNFNMILHRIDASLNAVSSLDSLGALSKKGMYIVNLIHDFATHFPQFLFVGVGAGSYSSRTALLFTGEYSKSFHIENISDFFYHNTYNLWQQLLNSPPWLAGAFEYPYNSIGTFIAELGLIPTIFIFFLFYKKLKRMYIFSLKQRVFLLCFLLLSALIDNYIEYYQATFVFYYFISLLSSKKGRLYAIKK